MTHSCLVLNPGSSTLKVGIFQDTTLVAGKTIEIDRSGGPEVPSSNHPYAAAIATLLKDSSFVRPQVIGYRVVHGGNEFSTPVVLSSESLERLRRTVDLAPLHQPPALETIAAAMEFFPSALHVACFDTAFHQTLPETEKLLPIPRHCFGEGLRRYGFHGLSYESIASQLPCISSRAASGRTVVCHLGSGASVCGLVACKSRYTSMSFTPQDGLIMGTRSGRIDPGVLLHWMRGGASYQEVEARLTKQSGLLGISNSSSDMRRLLIESSQRVESSQAVEMFCHSAAREIVTAATAIGGLDVLVFTAGIGEHSPVVRSKIVQELAWIGARMSPVANDANHATIQSSDSSFEILRIPTDEQKIIAEHAMRFLIEACR